MFTTEMRDLMDGTIYPRINYQTKEQAIAYAETRTRQRQCEITVREGNTVIGVYADGAVMVGK